MAKQRKQSDAAVTLGTIWETAADWGTRIGFWAAVATLGIMAYQVFGGSLFKATAPNAVAIVDRISSWHLYMALLAALLVGIRRTEKSEEHFGYVAIYGVAMWFGFSYLVRAMGNKHAAQTWQQSEAVRVLLDNVVRAGQWSLVTLLIPSLRAGWGRVMARAEMKASRWESGLKANADTPRWASVSTIGSPPSAGTTASCGRPPGRARRKPIRRPSGDTFGQVSRNPRVIRTGAPPVSATRHNCPT